MVKERVKVERKQFSGAVKRMFGWLLTNAVISRAHGPLRYNTRERYILDAVKTCRGVAEIQPVSQALL